MRASFDDQEVMGSHGGNSDRFANVNVEENKGNANTDRDTRLELDDLKQLSSGGSSYRMHGTDRSYASDAPATLEDYEKKHTKLQKQMIMVEQENTNLRASNRTLTAELQQITV